MIPLNIAAIEAILRATERAGATRQAPKLAKWAWTVGPTAVAGVVSKVVEVYLNRRQRTPPKVHIKHEGTEIVLDDNPTPQQIQALKDLLDSIHSKEAQARDTGPDSAGQQADNQARGRPLWDPGKDSSQNSRIVKNELGS